MRIILISYDFYPNIGGVTQHVLNLGRFLSKNKNEVYVFTMRNNLNQKFFEYLDGIKIFRFFSPNVSKIRGLFFLFQASIFGFLFSLFKKINIVHSHTVIPDSFVGLFIFSKIKIFTNHTSQFLELYDDKNKIFIKIIYKFIMKFYDFIIAPSEELKEKSIKFFNFKKDKVFFIPNGVDIQRFKPINIKEKYNKKLEIFKFWNLEQRKYLIFCPRRLEPKNGVEFFIKAIQLLIKEEKNFWAIISGNEYILSYADFIKNLIKELNLKNYILFTGAIPNEEIVDYYQASDIVVLPSLIEAVSISGLEALACGIPVVGTKVGGIPFIVLNKENGLLVEPKNYYEIYESILYLIKNDKLRFNMSKKARQLIENNFSWDKLVSRIESIYKNE